MYEDSILVLTKINHVNELKDQGYTILRNVLDPETDIQPLINENVQQTVKNIVKIIDPMNMKTVLVPMIA